MPTYSSEQAKTLENIPENIQDGDHHQFADNKEKMAEQRKLG